MKKWSKEVFAQNLKRYMDEHGKNQKEMAEIIGVSTSSINDWLLCKKYPRIDKIEMLADYFGILKSDLIETCPENTLSKIEIGRIIAIAREKNDISVERLAQKMGCSVWAIKEIEKGSYETLTVSTVRLLAKILHLNAAKLMGLDESNTVAPSKVPLTPSQRNLWLSTFDDVEFTDEEFDDIINYAKFVLSKRPAEN